MFSFLKQLFQTKEKPNLTKLYYEGLRESNRLEDEFLQKIEDNKTTNNIKRAAREIYNQKINNLIKTNGIFIGISIYRPFQSHIITSATSIYKDADIQKLVWEEYERNIEEWKKPDKYYWDIYELPFEKRTKYYKKDE